MQVVVVWLMAVHPLDGPGFDLFRNLNEFVFVD
jgi:hypothetical protein